MFIGPNQDSNIQIKSNGSGQCGVNSKQHSIQARRGSAVPAGKMVPGDQSDQEVSQAECPAQKLLDGHERSNHGPQLSPS